MTPALNFRFCLRRFHRQASQDPNIRSRESVVGSRLKRETYAGSGSEGSVRKLEQEFRNKLPEMTQDELIDSAYNLTKLSRRRGQSLRADLINQLFHRLFASEDTLSRHDLIRVIQVCAAALPKGREYSEEMRPLIERRDEFVTKSVTMISGRHRDIPIPSLGVLMSALARIYDPSIRTFFEAVAADVSDRIADNMTEVHQSPSRGVDRGDLLRMVPYFVRVFNQAQVPVPSGLLENSISLYTKFMEEAPFSHLSEFINEASRSGGSELVPVIEYAGKALRTELVENFTVIDIARTVAGMTRVDMQTAEAIMPYISDIVNARPHSEWTTHAIVEWSKLPASIWSTNLRKRLFDEMKGRQSELPPTYVGELFLNLTCIGDPDLTEFLSQMVLMNLRYLPCGKIAVLLDACINLPLSDHIVGSLGYVASRELMRRSHEPSDREAIYRFSNRFPSFTVPQWFHI